MIFLLCDVKKYLHNRMVFTIFAVDLDHEPSVGGEGECLGDVVG